MAQNMTKMAKKFPDGVYRLRMATFEVVYFLEFVLRLLQMGLFWGIGDGFPNTSHVSMEHGYIFG